MVTLYQIEAEHAALEALLEEAGGEITPENEAALDAFFAECTTNIEGKLNGYCELIRKFENDAVAAKARKDEFTKLLAVKENSAEYLRDRVKAFGVNTGLLTVNAKDGKKTTPGRKINTPRWEIGIQKSGGSQKLEMIPGVEVDDQFTKMVKVTDNEAIRDYLEAGGTLPFARLAERGVTLKIKSGVSNV